MFKSRGIPLSVLFALTLLVCGPSWAANPESQSNSTWRALIDGWANPDPDPEPNSIWRDPEPEPVYRYWFEPEPQPMIVGRAEFDSYWLSYRSVDRIAARLVNLGGAGAERSLFESTSLGYLRHVSAFNLGRGTLLAAAESGPRIGGTTISRQIEVAGFNDQGQPLQRRIIPLSSNSELSWRPDLALSADPLSSDCCALLAWSNRSATAPGIEFERLDRVGKPLGQRMRIPAPAGLGQARHPALAWQADSGDFLLVYETRADVRARLIAAMGGTIGPEIVVAKKLTNATLDEYSNSRPAVAYSRTLKTFMIAWQDRDWLGTRMVRASTLDGFGRLPATPWVIKPCCTSGPGPDPSPLDALTLVAHPQGFALLMAARASANAKFDLASYRLQMSHRFGAVADLRWLQPQSVVRRETPAVAAVTGTGDLAVTFLDGQHLFAARHQP